MNTNIISDIRQIISQSRESAARSIDFARTLMFWGIGQRIFEEEQQGKERADYGEYLTKYIAESLEPDFGTGFSRRQIELSRQFYRLFPIANTLHSQLSWIQYNSKTTIIMFNAEVNCYV